MNRNIRSLLLATLGGFGVLYALLTPPFQVPDEVNHFVRAYQIAHWLPVVRDGDRIGARIPLPLSEAVAAFQELKSHSERHITPRQWRDEWNRFSVVETPGKEMAFMDLSNTILYSAVPYLPQIVGLEVGALFGARPFLLLYLARLFNLFAYLLGAAACLWLVRDSARCSLAFGIVFAFPMALSLGASASADGMTIVLGALMAAWCYRLSISVTQESFAGALVVTAALSFCKPVYWPLAFPLAAAVFHASQLARRAGSRFNLRVMWVAVCTLVPLWIWTQVVHQRFARPHVGFNVDPQVQMSLLKAHPFLAARNWLVALWNQWPFLRRSWIGLLGWEDTPIPAYVRGAWLDVFLLAVFVAPIRSRRFELSARGVLLMFFAILLSVELLCLAIFLTWTPAGELTLNLMQGRYFLPITFGWLLLVPALRILSEKRWQVFAGVMVGVSVFLEGASLRALVSRYWN